ncbi:MAG: LPS assembly protein LptD [Pseudomonadota bacterium]
MIKWTSCVAFAALAFSIMPPASAQTEDAIPISQPQVTLDADTILVNEETNTVIAEGNVEAEYQGRVMRADRLEYNRTTDKVRAVGNVVIIDLDGTQRFADEIETDSNLSDGYAVGFSTRLAEGGTATAETAIREPGGFNALDKVIYTACEVCEGDTRPTWALRARRAVLDQEDQMISYRDAVLEIAGVPVFYLPYFAHPDPNSDRRSGLLPPDLGASSKRGVFYQQPYYWAISPYSDLVISPEVTSKVNPLLEFDYRKRFWSGDLEANFSITRERDFDSDGEKFDDTEWRGHIFADGRFNIRPNWDWGFGVEYMSDDQFTRRYDIDGELDDRGIFRSQPRRLLNQLFVQGQDTSWYADASLLSFNGLRANDNDDELPRALPFFFSERLFDFGNNGLLGVSASAAFLDRKDGEDSYRASIASDWRTTRVLPGGILIEPFVDARFDAYQIDDIGASEDSFDVQRGAANAGVILSYPLYRPGKAFDILIEPTIMGVLGTSDVNDADIPVEDSLLFEFNETSLFDSNAYAGFDLYDDGNKLSAGLSATMTWKNGVNISALGGRRWRSESSSFLSEQSNLDGTVSDWVAGFSADFGNPLQIETSIRLDDDSLDVNRVDASVSSQIWRLSASARYYRLNERLSSTGVIDEGVDIEGEVEITENYSFIYGRRRDITDERDLRHLFGIAYQDDCSRFEIAYERSETNDRSIGPNESIRFRFVLQTLGGLGSSDVD